MFMRFRGGGIGHKVTRDWDDILQREGHGAEEAEQEVTDMGSEDSEAEDVGFWIHIGYDASAIPLCNTEHGLSVIAHRYLMDRLLSISDDILQREGHGAEEAEQEVTDMGSEDSEAEDETEEEWDDDVAVDNNDGSDSDGNGSDDEDNSSDDNDNGDDDEDRVVADEGEVLDDDVLAEEGYAAL
jgi:hypothetical protein